MSQMKAINNNNNLPVLCQGCVAQSFMSKLCSINDGIT